MSTEKRLKKIHAVDPGGYWPTGSKFFVVLDANNDKPVDAAHGHLVEYTALLRLLERNKNDDRAIGLIHSFAQGLCATPSASVEGAK